MNGTDLFLLKGRAKSDDNDISCAININLHSYLIIKDKI